MLCVCVCVCVCVCGGVGYVSVCMCAKKRGDSGGGLRNIGPMVWWILHPLIKG